MFNKDTGPSPRVFSQHFCVYRNTITQKKKKTADARYQVTFSYSGKCFFFFFLFFKRKKILESHFIATLSKKSLRHRCVPVNFTNKMV